jgi:hypothetical protein
LVKTGFFDYLAFALQFAPAEPQEKEIRAKLARLGIEAGKKFDLAALSPEQKAAVVAGVKEGRRQDRQVSRVRTKEPFRGARSVNLS